MKNLTFIRSNNQDVVEELLSRAPEEGRDLDYKRELPPSDRDSKREFLADVISFANTDGGHLVFGVDEKGGRPVAVPGCDAEDLQIAVPCTFLARHGRSGRIGCHAAG